MSTPTLNPHSSHFANMKECRTQMEFKSWLFGDIFALFQIFDVFVLCFRSLLSSNITSACNLDCGCRENRYDPVCGGNDVMYYSPCYAGCKNSVSIGKKKVPDSVVFVKLVKIMVKPGGGGGGYCWCKYRLGRSNYHVIIFSLRLHIWKIRNGWASCKELICSLTCLWFVYFFQVYYNCTCVDLPAGISGTELHHITAGKR